MEKGKKILIIVILILIAVFAGLYYFNNARERALTGQVVSGVPQMGPGQEVQSCMMACMGCTSPGIGCTGNREACLAQCDAEKPEQTSEEICVETCAKNGCEEFDFSCQERNRAVCDKECGMVKEPEAKSEEEQCIRDCVNAESPGLICQAGEGGEQGGAICQECAESCEYLYEGPCLDDLKLEQAKSACGTCENCYAEPEMGDSGEGYECIVSVKCGDSSAEFGDESGPGPGVGQEGFVAKVGDAVGGFLGGIGDFFSELFGG